MAKLTLSVDEAVVARAKELARRRQTSISALVERYLDVLAQVPERRRGIEGKELPPITARLAGLLRGKGAWRDEYLRYIDEKYR